MEGNFLRRCNQLVSRSKVVGPVLVASFVLRFASALDLRWFNLIWVILWVLVLPLAAAAYAWCAQEHLLTWREVWAIFRRRGDVIGLRWAVGYFGSAVVFLLLGQGVVWAVKLVAGIYPPPPYESVNYVAVVVVSWLFPLFSRPWYGMLAVVAAVLPGRQVGVVFAETWRRCRRWLGVCLLLGLVSAAVSRGAAPFLMMVLAPFQPVSVVLSRLFVGVAAGLDALVTTGFVLVYAALYARRVPMLS